MGDLQEKLQQFKKLSLTKDENEPVTYQTQLLSVDNYQGEDLIG